MKVSKLILRANGLQLIDHYRLQDYEFSYSSEIDVSILSGTIAFPSTIITFSESSVNNQNGSKEINNYSMIFPKYTI